MEVRRLRADEWEHWRAFRLAMLQDTPSAYGTTYAEAVAMSDEDWRERTARMAGSAETVMYLAEAGGEWLSCAGGFLDDGVPTIFGVWTRPEARGRGAGRLAVERVVEWAREQGAAEVRLGVTETNAAACRLYERLGFSPNGRTEPLRSDASLTLAEWSKPL
ncbi:MAG TPA: GNAT family N-acetyltransferase [Mycobacteriales bacterium]|jgi:ribosomal protein S18 acetylase RimI-like enzyme